MNLFSQLGAHGPRSGRKLTLEKALMRVVKVLVVGATPSAHILSYTASALCGCPSFVHVVSIRLYVSTSGASPCGHFSLLSSNLQVSHR